MTFTNISGVGVYMQCCHREVEPGGSFVVPFHVVRRDRGLHSAMQGGVLSWESGYGEPVIAGSPGITGEQIARRAAEDAELAARRAAEDVRDVEIMKRLDEEAVRANMARMGSFDVPQTADYKVRARAVAKERPITDADVIADDKPKSLADIRRHNRAVRKISSGTRKSAKD